MRKLFEKQAEILDHTAGMDLCLQDCTLVPAVCDSATLKAVNSLPAAHWQAHYRMCIPLGSGQGTFLPIPTQAQLLTFPLPHCQGAKGKRNLDMLVSISQMWV